MFGIRIQNQSFSRLSLGRIGLLRPVPKAPSICKIGSAVPSEPMLNNGTVLLILHSLPIVCGIHTEEVIVLSVNSILAIRRDGCPVLCNLLLLLAGNICKLAGCYLIFELKDLLSALFGGILLLGALALLGFIILLIFRESRGYLKGKITVILQLHILNWKMLRIKRVQHNLGDLGSNHSHIPQLLLCAKLRVHNIVLRTLGGLETIPELIRILKPIRLYISRKEQFTNLL